MVGNNVLNYHSDRVFPVSHRAALVGRLMGFICVHLFQGLLSSSRPLKRMTPTVVCLCPSLHDITLGHKDLLLPHLQAPFTRPQAPACVPSASWTISARGSCPRHRLQLLHCPLSLPHRHVPLSLATSPPLSDPLRSACRVPRACAFSRVPLPLPSVSPFLPLSKLMKILPFLPRLSPSS